MNKKWMSLLLVIIITFAFCACKNRQEQQPENMVEAVGSTDPASGQKKQEKGLYFEVPESFEQDADLPDFYRSDDYQRDLACIFYQEYDTQERQELLTEDNIAPLMQEIYAELYGMEVTVEMVDFHKFRLDGYDGCRIETELTTDEAVLQNIEYVIYAGEKSYSVTYRQRKSAGWVETFAHSADNLQIWE